MELVGFITAFVLSHYMLEYMEHVIKESKRS